MCCCFESWQEFITNIGTRCSRSKLANRVFDPLTSKGSRVRNATTAKIPELNRQEGNFTNARNSKQPRRLFDMPTSPANPTRYRNSFCKVGSMASAHMR